MTTFINASTSAGLVQTADTSGSLALQTASTTALTLDTSQNATFAGSVKTNTLTSAASTALTLQSAGTTAVTIDTSQNVGIGGAVTNEGGYSRCLQVTGATEAALELKTGSSYSYLAQNGATLQIRNNDASGNMTFATNATERMRIDSSGYVGIGVNNPNLYAGLVCRKAVSGTWNGVSSNASFTASDAIGSTFVISHSSANSYTTFLSSDAGGRLQMYCSGTGSGGVYLGNGGTSWTSASDERVKDIIEPIENGLTKVASLRAVIGKYKTDEEGTRRSFLIAQDVEAVLPEAVNYSNPDELGLSYTDVIPLLVASIKELKTINDTQAETINALTARIVALESK